MVGVEEPKGPKGASLLLVLLLKMIASLLLLLLLKVRLQETLEIKDRHRPRVLR